MNAMIANSILSIPERLMRRVFLGSAGIETRLLTESKKAVILRCMLLFILAMISWVALRNFEGNPYVFILFGVSFPAMVALILPGPRLYSYTFLAALLFLGFWVKVMTYLLFKTEFLEPVGTFRGLPHEWNLALGYASMAAIGACAVRLLHLWKSHGNDWAASTNIEFSSTTPSWYVGLRRILWGGSFAILILLNAINFQIAFYQTGVNPKLILPMHLNVLASWLINVGFALWFACLIHWEIQHSAKRFANALIAPIVEAFLSSVSALSRSFYVMHTVPYFICMGMQWARVRGILKRRDRVGLILLWALVFTLSLGLVSWFRIHIYYLGYTVSYFAIPAGGAGDITEGATLANQIRPMVQQVSNLFFARWTGLEGTLAVTAFESKSIDFLIEAFQESPKIGNEAVYQKIAGSPYAASKAFTFLTLPGLVAILAYSGSMLVVLVGTALTVLLAIVTEITGMRLTGNPFLLSVASLTLANVLCQTHFPYLTAIFVVQIWVALIFIYGLQTLSWRRVRVPDDGNGLKAKSSGTTV